MAIFFYMAKIVIMIDSKKFYGKISNDPDFLHEYGKTSQNNHL
jgi:hypothetical protein